MNKVGETKLTKLFEHMQKQEIFQLGILKKDNGEISIMYEFGREAEDSPMYGGAAYGIGNTMDEALQPLYNDLRINL